jgi:tRNA pseudouridine32 synthase/23S rRNA pseudouridine746 synthase
LNTSRFIPFANPILDSDIPEKFLLMQHNTPHKLCLIAANQLQDYLLKQTDWVHNFGLNNNINGNIIGKMFGVLVVKNLKNEIGFLAAFSGKLANTNSHPYFVPPVFDSLAENSFLNKGMIQLSALIDEINELETQQQIINLPQISALKIKRKEHSKKLQHLLFDNYIFTNQLGNSKNAHEVYKNALYKNPPAGGGECATPKLLQHAFNNKMKPLAVAEFWWGHSPKSKHWKHKQFYACCKEKCEPILSHMLIGIEFEYL